MLTKGDKLVFKMIIKRKKKQKVGLFPRPHNVVAPFVRKCSWIARFLM